MSLRRAILFGAPALLLLLFFIGDMTLQQRRWAPVALSQREAAPPASADDGAPRDWREYAGDKGGSHYSPLREINRDNVGRLEPAWSHHSGDAAFDDPRAVPTTLQVTPLVVEDTLYYCTAYMRVFALDAETGEERWVFDPVLKNKSSGGPYPLTCRGIAYWEDEGRKGDACGRRILYGTRDSELLALDAKSGEPCEGFGEGGRVSLREGLGEIPEWEYYPTSPPMIVGDTLVLGALVADQLRTDAPSGVVRAFDVRSGKLLWGWDPVPEDFARGRRPGELYHRGTPNVWAPMSADPEHGLVFVPTGNPAPDSWAAGREGLGTYGSSTVALDVRTGELVWHYQFVHHDVWDYDTPAQPTLFQLAGVGGGRPALAQPTKMGHLFLLDRLTGAPLYPVEERPVPGGGAPGETLSPTQPFPTHPPPLHPTDFGEEDVFGFTPFDRRACRKLLKRYRFEGIFTPPDTRGSVQMPHSAGGMNWGGVAIDPERGLLITNQTHLAMVVQLVPRSEYDAMEDKRPRYPEELYPMEGTPYAVRRFPLFSPLGAPCNPPPWGSLTAVDLRSGELRWRVALGSLRDTAPAPIWALPWWQDLGTPNFGGGLLTGGGLYFIGATTDRAFRAFDVESGAELWRARIETTANASPMTYRVRPGGRQFVVVAAGGNPLTRMSDALLAFALPEDEE